MKRSLLPVMSLVFAAAAPLHASHAQRKIVPYLGIGMASGMGALGEGTDTGYLIFGGLNWIVSSTPGLSIGATVSYTHIPYGGGYSDATNIPALFGEVGYMFGATSASKVKPFVRGGVGILQHRYDPGDYGYKAESQSKMGLGAGAGLNFVLRAASLLLGAHMINAGDSSFLAFYGGVGFGK